MSRILAGPEACAFLASQWSRGGGRERFERFGSERHLGATHWGCTVAWQTLHGSYGKGGSSQLGFKSEG